MADIFISYSKSDRDKVVMLAAYLESEGWTVWWDSNLAIGDAYRDEIMKQLAVARTVIVLWSQHSINSDFVRAEAGRAKADGKLIPVKDGVEYGDIPLPFGEMHTEELSKKELLRAAVATQLAKPQVQPSALTLTAKTLRYQVLTWVGIVGGAITLFANAQGVLTLSNWARWLIEHWLEITGTFWSFVFSLLGIDLPKAFSPYLTFTLFCLGTAFGARALSRQSEKIERKGLIKFAVYSAAGLVLFSVVFFSGLLEAVGLFDLAAFVREVLHLNKFTTFAVASLIPLVIFMYFQKHSLHATVVFFLLLGLFNFLIVGPALYDEGSVTWGAWLKTIWGPVGRVARALGWDVNNADDFDDVFVATLLILNVSIPVVTFLGVYVLPAVMLAIAPLDTLIRRLAFLMVGFIVLAALNQLSLYAFHIQEVLKPPV